MIRAALAGLLTACTLALTAIAAPPPPPPPLPDDTPETIDGYNTFYMYRNFTGWTQREAAAGLKARADLADTALTLDNGIRVMSFRVKADWPYYGSAGGIEEVCEQPEGALFSTGRATLSEEEIAELCYWQLRVYDLKDAREKAQTWMGAAFDVQRAADYLASINIPKDVDFTRKKIDWSGYQSSEALRTAPVLRQRIYTSRTCDMFPAAFDAIQSIPLSGFQIEGFNKRAEIDHGIPHSSWLDVTVYSVNGGAEGQLRFFGYAGMPSTLLDVVDNLIDTCEPEPAG